MDQVYRSFRKFGTIILAMFMFVSIFDAQLIDAEGSNSTAKITHTCDEQNVQVYESNGELMIPWNSTIETAASDLVKYTSYEAVMQEHVWSTPDELKLIVQEENSGETKTLVEGTDFEILYKSDDGLYEADKEKVKTFQGFKLLFHKEESFFKLVIHYNTFGKISDLTESEENRSFITDGSWKVENDEFITQETTHTYSNPNYKPVENTEPVETSKETATKEYNWEDDEVTIKATVTNGVLPDDAVLTAEKVSDTSSQYKEVVEKIEDADKGTVYYYKVYFTSNGEKIDVAQESMNVTISLKEKKEDATMQVFSVEKNAKVSQMASTKQSVATFSTTTVPDGYAIWWQDKWEENGEIDHTSSYKYGDFGEETDYNMFYILAHYNAFVYEDYSGQHVVGPMAVGGNAGCFPGGSTTGVIYPHDVPSFFKGTISQQTISTFSNVPVFIGTGTNTKNEEVLNNKKAYFLTGIDSETGKIRVYENYYYTTNDTDYINFNTAFNNIKNQMKVYSTASYTGEDPAGNKLTSVEIKPYSIAPESNKVVKGDKEQYYFEKSADGTGLRIKLGYNYIITDTLLKTLDYIVYDYENFSEATTKTTFINIAGNGDVVLPKMYKAQNDSLGATPAISSAGEIKSAYQFDSKEVERAFNIAYLLKDATNVTFHSGGKLVGHLVAPNAKVSIAGGDYNGSVIAKNVQSSAEAHMWPFKLDAEISFNKTVNGKKPESGEVFKFTLENISKPQNAAEIPNAAALSTSTGLVSFPIKNLTVQGDYVYKITENDAGEGYIKNNDVYYALVRMSKENTTSGKPTPKFMGFYKTYTGNGVVSDSIGLDLVINNVRQLTVKKQWEKEDGTVFENTSNFQNVEFELVQKYKEDNGFTITYNFYGACNNKPTEFIEKKEIRNVAKNGSYKIEITGKENYQTIQSVAVNSGSATLSEKDTIIENSRINKKMTLSNVMTDVEVNIYLYDQGNSFDINKYKIDLLETDSDNQKSIVNESDLTNGEKTINSFTLGQNNDWKKEFNDLPSSGAVDGHSGKDFKFSYYVKEIEVPGFETIYSENNSSGVTTGVIIVTNKAKPRDLVVSKVSSTGNNSALAGAKFKLFSGTTMENKKQIIFKETQGTYVFEKICNDDRLGTEMITDSLGKLKLIDLPTGDYILEETQAPNGFVIDSPYIYIHIDYDLNKSYYKIDDRTDLINTDTGNRIEYALTVENTPDIEVPETGGTFDGRYQKLGFLIACSGLAMFALYECRRNKNIKKSKN